MFLIASTFISGKEASSAFTEGTNEFSSELQSTITQVSDGQYSDVNLTCTVAEPSDQLTFTTASAASSLQGTNSSCDFLGKFVHMDEASSQTAYEIFDIAGARTDDTLASATPVVGNGIDLTDQETTPQALKVQDVKVTNATTGATVTSYGIGFVQSQANCNVDDSCVSGAQTVYMVYSPGLNGTGGSMMNETSAKNAITSNLSAASAAAICLTDGSRYAKISLGDSASAASQLNVTVDAYTLPYATNPPC
jgi:hypothetical protein